MSGVAMLGDSITRVMRRALRRKARSTFFVGLAPNRKGWVLFDPKTRKLRTTFHCAFDESLKDRRCGLLDFVLRPRKAGAGASRDEE